MRDKGSFEWSSWAELVGVLAAYILIVFVLCPENSLVGFPVHRDDFSLLSWDANSLRTYGPRLAGAACFHACLDRTQRGGLPAYYLGQQALMILYVYLR